MKSPILGGAYVARSVNAAANELVNLFPEVVPEGGKEKGFLMRAPGLRLLTTIGLGPIRGMHVTGRLLYVVSGPYLYSLDGDFASTQLGAIGGEGRVSIADNGVQLFIATDGPGYIFDTTAGTLQQITDPDFPGASVVDYIDGYFVFIEPNSQKVWVTGLLDGSGIDALDFASTEANPDPLVSLLVDHREVWLFGSNSVEVWYNSGDVDFPLQRVQGAFSEVGCAAKNSVAKLDNSVFWLGADSRGNGIIYRANGYSPVRVSTHAVEWQIQQYSDISDATAYTYQQDGHAFYVLNFPSGNTTWVYDASTASWHKRARLEFDIFKRHRGEFQANFAGKIVITDFENVNLYEYSLDDFTDNGAPQKWVRSWRALPPGGNNLTRTAHHSLQIDCETGTVTDSSSPSMVLRWSDDGGRTWSNEHWRSMGKIGEYARRVIWRRLGMTTKLRDRVYEISGTDPVRIYIMGAELSVTGTNA